MTNENISCLPSYWIDWFFCLNIQRNKVNEEFSFPYVPLFHKTPNFAVSSTLG